MPHNKQVKVPKAPSLKRRAISRRKRKEGKPINKGFKAALEKRYGNRKKSK